MAAKVQSAQQPAGESSSSSLSLSAAKMPEQARELIKHMSGSGQKANITSLEKAAGGRDDFNAMAFQILDDFFGYYDLVFSKRDDKKQSNMMLVATLIRKSAIKPDELAELHADFTKQPQGYNKMMMPLHNFTTIKSGGDFDSLGKISKQSTDKHPLDALSNTIRYGIEPVQEDMTIGERRPINKTQFMDVPPIIDLVRETHNRLIKTLHQITEAMWNHPRLPGPLKNTYITKAFKDIKDERGWTLEGSIVDNIYVDKSGKKEDARGIFGTKHPDVRERALKYFKQKIRVSLSGAEDKKPAPVAQQTAEGAEVLAEGDVADPIYPWVEMTEGALPGKATHFYAKRRTTRIADEEIAKRYIKTEIDTMRNSKLYAIQDKDLIVHEASEYMDPKNRTKVLNFIPLVGYEYVPPNYLTSNRLPYVIPPAEGDELELIEKAKPDKPFVRQAAPNASLVCVDISFGPYINNDGKMGIHIRYGKDIKIPTRVFKRRLMEDFDVLSDYGVIRDVSDIPPEYVLHSNVPFAIQDADRAEADELQAQAERMAREKEEREAAEANEQPGRKRKRAPEDLGDAKSKTVVASSDDADVYLEDNTGSDRESPAAMEYEDL